MFIVELNVEDRMFSISCVTVGEIEDSITSFTFHLISTIAPHFQRVLINPDPEKFSHAVCRTGRTRFLSFPRFGRLPHTIPHYLIFGNSVGSTHTLNFFAFFFAILFWPLVIIRPLAISRLGQVCFCSAVLGKCCFIDTY